MSGYNSGSGGPYSELNPAELHQELEDCKIMVAGIQRGHPDDREERRAWSEEGTRRYANLNAVRDELAFRSEQKAKRQAEREKREEERWRLQDERKRKSAERKPAVRRDGGPSQSPRDQALIAYFKANGIEGWPRFTTTEIRFSWQAGGHYYYGIFGQDTKDLKVYIRVNGSPDGYKVFRGKRYLPATTKSEVAAAIPIAVPVDE